MSKALKASKKKLKKARAQAAAVEPKSAADLRHEEKKERGAREAGQLAEGAGDGKVLIKNTRDSIHTIGLPHKASTEGGVHDFLQLMPGINAVDAARWEKAKEQKMTQVYMEEGHLVEFGKRGLSELGDRAAVKLVKDTVDRSLLEQWRDTEERSAVVDAIDRQLAAIAPSAPAEDEEDDDFDTADGEEDRDTADDQP